MLSVLGGRGDEFKKNTALACLSVNCTFRKVMCQTPLLRITLGLSGMWLSWEASTSGASCEGEGRLRERGPTFFQGRANETRKSLIRWWLV